MIVSRQNSLVKLIRSLTDKKNRDQNNLFIAEGVKIINEAILLGADIYKIVATEKGLALLDKKALSFCVETVSEEIFSYVSGEVTPQGAIALIKKTNNKICSPTGNCLFLDGVSDSSNVGAIIRTAAACNFKEIYIANGADAYSPKSVRASMSGIFRVKVFSGTREELLNAINLPIIVADMHGENVFNSSLNDKFCLVIGNEAHGVSELLRQKAKYSVSIPMANGMESLNAAVSAGILMYILTNTLKGE